MISASSEDDDVVIRVRDTGIGMSPEILPHIFDIFMQGRQSIDRAHGGLGLGLAIVRSLVERHGGSVCAQSDGPNQGSQFIVRLPRTKAESPRPVPPADSAALQREPGGRAARVLVVDDNQDAADMLASALRLSGFDVQVAYDGPHALRIGASAHFDAALLDIGLPVMDGYELAARLRDVPSLRNIKLVAVTGYGQESDRRRALAAGFQDHLVKPVDFQLLEATLKNLPGDARQ